MERTKNFTEDPLVNQDINGDIAMPPIVESVIEPSENQFELELERSMDENTKSVDSSSTPEETDAIEKKKHKYVRLGNYLYIVSIIEPYMNQINLVYSNNKSLFNNNPIDIFRLEDEVTIFSLDTEYGQTQLCEALEKGYIKKESNYKELEESLIPNNKLFIEKYISSIQQGGDMMIASEQIENPITSNEPVDDIPIPTETSNDFADDTFSKKDKDDEDKGDEIIIQDRDNGAKTITITIENNMPNNNANNDTNVSKEETPINQSAGANTNNIKKITIVSDGKKKPRQPLDDFPETHSLKDDKSIDNIIVEESKETSISDNLGYNLDNYYVYGNYKYDIENIENIHGKEHMKQFLAKLNSLDIKYYLDPKSIRPIIDKKSIQHSMELYGNKHNV
jgi:hypothetical protein